MTFKIRDAGTLREITTGKVKAGGILRTLKTIKVWDGGALRTVKQFTTTLTASVSPASLYSAVANASPQTITTAAASASPTGGTAPYTYAWTQVSLTGGNTPTINTASLASTTFTQTSVAADAENVAVFRCTITDSFGQTATADIGVTFYNSGGIE